MVRFKELIHRGEAEEEAEPEAVVLPPGYRLLYEEEVANFKGIIGNLILSLGRRELTLHFVATGKRVYPEDPGFDPTVVIAVHIDSSEPSLTDRQGPRPWDPKTEAGPTISAGNYVLPETEAQIRLWCLHEDRRHTWKQGTPWPVQPAPDDQWLPLTPAVIKQILRAHRLVNDRWSEEHPDIRGNFLVDYDPQTAARMGPGAPSEFVDRRELSVSVPVSTYPDDIDFAPVRVDPVTGTVRPNSVGIRQEVSA